MDLLIDRIHRWVAMGNPACTRILLHPDDDKAFVKLDKAVLYKIIGDRPVEWLGENR